MNKYQSLVEAAVAARERSYCPYSGFAVGAALLTADGTVFTGANIESASYTPTVCAERVAVFTAVHQGQRQFEAIAVVGGEDGEPVTTYCPPCGVCRQVLAEFGHTAMPVLLYDGKQIKELTLGALLPEVFDKHNLD